MGIEIPFSCEQESVDIIPEKAPSCLIWEPDSLCTGRLHKH